MGEFRPQPDNDIPTAAAIGALAFISTMMIHEAAGHGGVCALLGGRWTLYPVSMQCSIESRWMVAAGPLANLVAGSALWLWPWRGLSGSLRYYVWLTMAFNWFNFAGYLGLGALTGFGDWGVVMGSAGWVFKAVVALAAGGLYYVFMRAVAGAGTFRGRRATRAPYLAAGVVACGAAALGPLGPSYVAVAAAASFGAGTGLLAIQDWAGDSRPDVLWRRYGWMATAIAATVPYLVVIGRGLRIGY